MGNKNENRETRAESTKVPYTKLSNDETKDEMIVDHGKDLPRAGQDHQNKSTYRNGDDDVISSSRTMEEVEAEEIISASVGFGNTSVTSSSSSPLDKQDREPQQQPIKRSNQPARMLSTKLVLLNLLANFLMFAIAGFITYHCFNKATVLFSWHPTFMSVGYFILMSQAVLTLSGANLLTYRRHHKTRVFVHWLLQAVGGILITIAFVCIVLNKIRMDKAHFQTTHGIFGLITVILTLGSIAGGVLAKYSFQLRQLLRPIYAKIIHGIAGTVAYILASVTIGLGIYSHWFQEDNNEQVRLALLIGIIAVTLYVIINPIAATISRTKSALRTTL